MIERLFFELMQVAVGTRSSLSRVMTNKEWEGVYVCCLKQTLVGMGYVAIQKLPKAQWPPSDVVLKFTAMATRIKSRNELLDKTCVAVCQRMDHDGLDAVILKGQANSINYPETLRPYRMPGDIDVWARPKGNGVIPIASKTGNNNVEYIDYSGVQAVIEYVRMQYRIKGSSDRPPMRYHHIDAPPVDGIPVEVHFRPSYKNSPIRNWRMQNWYKTRMDICIKNKCCLGFPVLTSSINVVYLMDHLFRHYFVEGLGLRQLMDYYFALRLWHNDVMECKDLQSQGIWSEGLGTPVMSKEEVMAVLRSFGMAKFAAAVMYVLQEAFENEECLLELEMRNEILGIERELKEINRELKEIGPQADEDGEQQLPDTAKLMSTYEISNERIIRRQLKKNNYLPWMICKPNEREGRRLLAEIMQGGNLGQYDTRDAALKKGGMMKHGVWKLKRVMRLVSIYPEEALWEPVFRVYHLLWRGING